MLRPGELSVQVTSPFVLLVASKLGASGAGLFSWSSSPPLLVTTKRVSPTIIGEQAARLCGKTPNSLFISSRQTASASVLSLYFSSVTPSLPAASPSVVQQSTSHRLLTK